MSTVTAADRQQQIKATLNKVGEIATLPEVTTRIIAAVDDPSSTARELHDIIKTDPALATKILKVVNSAFYGLPGQIADLDRAIVLLGLSAVKNIAISASISRLFTSSKLSDEFSARDIWHHSVGVAVAAREFCAIVGKRAFAEEAFLAGLIHDLGLLVERQAHPETLAEIIAEATEGKRSFCEIEQEKLGGVDHQILGAALAAKWKFPRPLQIVLGYHHTITNLTQENRLLPAMVFIADTLCAHNRDGFYLTACSQGIDEGLLESVGLSVEDFEAVSVELPEKIEAAEASLIG